MSWNLININDIIKWGFVFTLPLLIAVFLISRQYRPFIKQWRFSTYIVVVLSLIIIVISDIIDFYTIYKRAKLNIEGPVYIYGNNKNYIYFHIALIAIVILLFTLKRIRQSFIWGMLTLAIIFYSELLSWILSQSRDYLPSSWSVYHHTSLFIKYSLCFLIFNLAAASLFFLRKKIMAIFSD